MTGDLHAPFAALSAFGWHDLLTYAPTYEAVIRPALTGLGAPSAPEGGEGGAATAPGARVEAPFVHGPVVELGAGEDRADGLGAAAWLVAMPGAPRPDPRGTAPSAAAAPAAGRLGLDLTTALAGMPGAPAGAAIVPGAARPPAPGALGLAVYPPGAAHLRLEVAARPGGLAVAVRASDGRALDPRAVDLSVARPDGADAARVALAAAPDGALAGFAARAPGPVVARASARLDDRPIEALVDALVPEAGRVAPTAAAWCDGAAPAARLTLEVARGGRFLIGVVLRDAAGAALSSGAAWRTLGPGRARTAVAMPSAAGRSPRWVDVTVLAADDGLAPAGATRHLPGIDEHACQAVDR